MQINKNNNKILSNKYRKYIKKNWNKVFPNSHPESNKRNKIDLDIDNKNR